MKGCCCAFPPPHTQKRRGRTSVKIHPSSFCISRQHLYKKGGKTFFLSRPSLPTYFEMGSAEEERRKKNEEEGFLGEESFFLFFLSIPPSAPRPLSTSLKLRRRITCWGGSVQKISFLQLLALGGQGVGGPRTRGTGFFDTDLGATLFDGERKVDTCRLSLGQSR